MIDLVPFGKYKGQPIEVLESDPKYAEWMSQQPWLKQSHPSVYNFIINNFQEPSETPEHNAMQSRFLDRGFCFGVLAASKKAINREWSWWKSATSRYADDCVRFTPTVGATSTIKVSSDQEAITMCCGEVWKGTFHASRCIGSERIVKSWSNLVQTGCNVEFETLKGCDVALTFPSLLHSFSVECKPHVGDDYPAVLRQMKRSGAKVLLVGTFSSLAVSILQFERMMHSQGIAVVFLSEVETENEQPDCSVRDVVDVLSKRLGATPSKWEVLIDSQNGGTP